jgi:hypothetical protein
LGTNLLLDIYAWIVVGLYGSTEAYMNIVDPIKIIFAQYQKELR